MTWLGSGRAKDIGGSALFVLLPSSCTAMLVALVWEDAKWGIPVAVAALAAGFLTWRLLRGSRRRVSSAVQVGSLALAGAAGPLLAQAATRILIPALAFLLGLLVPPIVQLLGRVWGTSAAGSPPP